LLGESISRYDSVGAHFAVTRMGKVIWLHDFDRQVAAANGWNDGTVSIEVDGLYAGVEGDASTVWDDPSTPSKEQAMVLTPATVTALKALLRWIKQQLGPQMNAIVSHRQASDDRRNDPGSAIWQQAALPMSAELGCSDGGIGFKLGDGLPIPEVWDSRCVGIKY
jgi:N-acetyl-anhydromuramyl-L-alanine amidase AmpD